MFHVVLPNDLHLALKPRSRSRSARPVMPFVNQERLVLKFPYENESRTTTYKPPSMLKNPLPLFQVQKHLVAEISLTQTFYKQQLTSIDCGFTLQGMSGRLDEGGHEAKFDTMLL